MWQPAGDVAEAEAEAEAEADARGAVRALEALCAELKRREAGLEAMCERYEGVLRGLDADEDEEEVAVAVEAAAGEGGGGLEALLRSEEEALSLIGTPAARNADGWVDPVQEARERFLAQCTGAVPAPAPEFTVWQALQHVWEGEGDGEGEDAKEGERRKRSPLQSSDSMQAWASLLHCAGMGRAKQEDGAADADGAEAGKASVAAELDAHAGSLAKVLDAELAALTAAQTGERSEEGGEGGPTLTQLFRAWYMVNKVKQGCQFLRAASCLSDFSDEDLEAVLTMLASCCVQQQEFTESVPPPASQPPDSRDLPAAQLLTSLANGRGSSPDTPPLQQVLDCAPVSWKDITETVYQNKRAETTTPTQKFAALRAGASSRPLAQPPAILKRIDTVVEAQCALFRTSVEAVCCEVGAKCMPGAVRATRHLCEQLQSQQDRVPASSTDWPATLRYIRGLQDCFQPIAADAPRNVFVPRRK